MKKRITTKGQCTNCRRIFSKQMAAKHFEICFFQHDPKQGEKIFLIKVSDCASPFYWLYLAVPAKCTFTDIDALLRLLWLECCGHLSSFRINDARYESMPEGNDNGLDVTLSKILDKGAKIFYQYDFGSTTDLLLEVIDVYKGSLDTRAYLLMRNIEPEIACAQCDTVAAYICAFCREALCDKHIQKKSKHKCGIHGLLPLLNSPRSGECGYTGE